MHETSTLEIFNSAQVINHIFMSNHLIQLDFQLSLILHVNIWSMVRILVSF